jgi:hypothetical protein
MISLFFNFASAARLMAPYESMKRAAVRAHCMPRSSHQRKLSGLNHWSSVRSDVLRERFIGNRRSSRRPSGNSTVLKIIMTGLEPECIFRFPTFLPLTISGSEFSLPGLVSPEWKTPSTLAFASLVNDPSRFRASLVGRGCWFGCLTFLRRRNRFWWGS